MSIRQDIGIVTAYGYAVSKGYTGTEEQFAEDMANVGTNIDAITEAIDTFNNQTVPAATQAVTDEGIAQIGAVNQAGADQVDAVEDKGTIEIGAVEAAGTAQIGLVNGAGTTQVAAVNGAGTTQVGNVNTAGSTQVAAVNAKGEEVIQSIPADYSALTQEVSDLDQALRSNGTPYISSLEKHIGWITSAGKWTYTDNDGYQYIVVPIAGVTAVKVKVSGGSTMIAFVKTYTVPSWGDSVDFSAQSGFTGRIEVLPNTAYSYNSPSDANYLIVFTKNGGTVISITELLLDGYDATVRLYKEIADIKDSIKNVGSTELKVNRLETAVENGEYKKPLEWISGSVTNNGLNNAITFDTSTASFLQHRKYALSTFRANTRISVPSGYQLRVYKINTSNILLKFIENITDIYLEDGYYAILVIADGDIENTDINNVITISEPTLAQVNYYHSEDVITHLGGLLYLDWVFGSPVSLNVGDTVTMTTSIDRLMDRKTAYFTSEKIMTVTVATGYSVYWVKVNGSNVITENCGADYLTGTFSLKAGSYYIVVKKDNTNIYDIDANNIVFVRVEYGLQEEEDTTPYELVLKAGTGKILFIGDSLTESAQTYDVKFPQMFETKTGIETYNEGHSGYDAKQWWNEFGSSYDFTPYHTFVIWLGTNRGLTDTLDTDVIPYENYADFADTYTGCYCKIIKKIFDTVDNPKIFLGTIFATGGDLAVTNAVIYKIANYYSYIVAGVVDNNKPELYVSHQFNTPVHPYGGDDIHFGTYGNAILMENWLLGIRALIKARARMFARGDCNMDSYSQFNYHTATISVGETKKLPAIAYPKKYTKKFSSSDTSIATVDASGNVTGVSTGTVNIIVQPSNYEYSDTCVVTVTN